MIFKQVKKIKMETAMQETKSKEPVSITRIFIRERVKYSMPAKYSGSTKLIYIDEFGEHERYYSERLKTYKQFIEWVKGKYGSDRQYNIDYSKPYIHTI